MPTYLSPGVYVEEIDTGPKPLTAPATAVAAFVGYTEKAPADDSGAPRLITNWSQYQENYGGFVEGALLPYAVFGWFLNGGQNAYVVRIPHTEPSEEPAQLQLNAKGAEDTDVLKVVSKVEEPVSVVIEPATSGEDTSGDFDLRVRSNDIEVEAFEGLTLGDAADKVNTQSAYVQVETQTAEGITSPVLGRFPLAPPAPTPIDVSVSDFEGSEPDRKGINGLIIAEDVTMVIVPDLYNICLKPKPAEEGAEEGAEPEYELDLARWKSIQTMMINHCERQANRMAVLDAPPDMSPQEVRDWRSDVAMYDSKFAAFYYPWIEVNDPTAANGGSRLVPPSGHVAGLWARTDETRGVWKAPANEVISGALNVEYKMTKGEQDILNPIGINAIRPFGTRGIRVWGSRTLSSDAAWRYIPVRRLFNMVETAIMDGTQWVVFEPNDQTLWDRVTRTVAGFLLGLWRDGALFGATPDQAFYVKCDAETNPPESIAEGKLICEIGIAPVKPAEFVIFRISQWMPA